MEDAISKPRRLASRTAFLLTAIVILSSAFHFWPFEGRRSWELLGPMNAAIVMWMLVIGGSCLATRNLAGVAANLPHVSLLAYVFISGLSTAFAPDPHRAMAAAGKLVLVCVGGYMLFSRAVSSRKTLAGVYRLVTAALALAVGYCLVTKLVHDGWACGFFESRYKYGSYVGMLTPLCAVFMLTDPRRWPRIIGGVLVVAASLSSGSAGCVLAIGAGLATAAVLAPQRALRLRIGWAAGCSMLTLAALWHTPLVEPLRQDILIRETNVTDVRQRYCEWQALINLLESRAGTGSGVGCVNEYRSSFYYRLPKLNTLASFDQNGWLVTSAESGLIGLVCFCWTMVHHLRLSAAARLPGSRTRPPGSIERYDVANCAGLAGVCLANIFSAVQHNGILPLFVIILALTARAAHLRERERDGQTSMG